MVTEHPFDASDYRVDESVGDDVKELLKPVFTGEALPERLDPVLTTNLMNAANTDTTGNSGIAWLMLGSAWCNYKQSTAAKGTQFASSAKNLIERDGLGLPEAQRFADALIGFYLTQYPEVQSLLPVDKVGPAMNNAMKRIANALSGIKLIQTKLDGGRPDIAE